MQYVLKSKIFISAMLALTAIATTAVISVNVGSSKMNHLQRQLDLGQRYASEMDFENAVIAYEDALEIDPYCLDAYLGLSDIYVALGQYDKAMEIMEQARQMLPDSEDVYVKMAQLYAQQEQFDLAISILEEGINMTDSDRLRDVLREYQPGEAPVERAGGNPAVRGAEENAPADIEEASLVIGLEEEGTMPVLTVARNDEAPVAIPIVLPVEREPADNEDQVNDFDLDRWNYSSEDENGAGTDSGNGDSHGRRPGSWEGNNEENPEDGNEEDVTNEDPEDGNEEDVTNEDPGDGNEEERPGGNPGDGNEEERPGGNPGDGNEEERPGGNSGDGNEEERPGGNSGDGNEEERPGGNSGDGNEEERPGGNSGDGNGENGSDEDTEEEPVEYNNGITGLVSGVDGQMLEGVTISVYSGQEETPVVTLTDQTGYYRQGLALPGTYRIVLSKEGYADLSTSVVVWENVFQSISYMMLTVEESRQLANLRGIVLNAVDDRTVEGATVSLLDGYDNTSSGSQEGAGNGRHTLTGSDGSFSMEGITAGYYTMEVSRDNYSTYIRNETIKPGENEFSIVISPTIQTWNTYRIVLTWGEKPRDLDSHLICSGNDNYHVCYWQKDSSDRNANLDRDDVDSYGPETVTLKVAEGNSYIYAVHNYTDRYTSPGNSAAWNLAKSRARVEVYDGGGIIFEGSVPTDKEGITWEVFRIEDGRLIVTNEVGFQNPSELNRVMPDDENAGLPMALGAAEDGSTGTELSAASGEEGQDESTGEAGSDINAGVPGNADLAGNNAALAENSAIFGNAGTDGNGENTVSSENAGDIGPDGSTGVPGSEVTPEIPTVIGNEAEEDGQMTVTDEVNSQHPGEPESVMPDDGNEGVPMAPAPDAAEDGSAGTELPAASGEEGQYESTGEAGSDMNTGVPGNADLAGSNEALAENSAISGNAGTDENEGNDVSSENAGGIEPDGSTGVSGEATPEISTVIGSEAGEENS